ncbi:1229_t:CDS:1, partial [Dentiscutata erythropus]
EDASSQGQTDMWVSTDKAIYYIEFKCYFQETMKELLITNLVKQVVNQIFEKEYYIDNIVYISKTQFAVDCICSTKTRNICSMSMQEFVTESGGLNIH